MFCHNDDFKQFGLVAIVVGSNVKKANGLNYLHLSRTFLNLHTQRNWILSVLNGENDNPFWSFPEIHSKKWWQRTSSGVMRISSLFNDLFVILITIIFLNKT